MKGKDKEQIQRAILEEYPGTDPEIDIDWDLGEIFFKAGDKTGYGRAIKWAVKAGENSLNKIYEAHKKELQEVRKAGMMKVVEWADWPCHHGTLAADTSRAENQKEVKP